MNDLEQVEGIGPKTKELLEKLKIYTVDDLINHYPYRYEVLKRSNLQEIKDGDKVVIDGVVEGQPTIIFLSPKLKKVIFRINTNKYISNVVVYNQVYLKETLKTGNPVTIFGRYDKIKNAIIANEVRLEKLPPEPSIESIYYQTAGLSRKTISKYILNVLENDYQVEERLPDYLVEKYNFLSKKEALYEIHNPRDVINLKKARQRLKYEELFLYLLKINYLKNINISNNSISRMIDRDKVNKLISNLPYELTPDQINTLNDIFLDMESNKKMNRLVQGDVGSGKTIVAFLAAYANYLSGYQTALMVPTELLANQHYLDALKLFKEYNVKVELLTSSTKKSKKEEILNKLSSGEIDIIIGTHSLIQSDIAFNNLGLVITDEQHRFGVHQRSIFKNKGIGVDVLSMSATPIPRTYALTIYGDMDVSSIKTKPLGRKDIITYFKREKDILEVLELMKNEVDNYHQIYVIAPMIDNDDNKESICDLEEKMNKAFGKICKISSIHGKMDTEEKDKIMKKYEKGEIDILISTTVIEVGVNVPNASMIVIFDANYFGLSTIHQLRGRVGRSDIQGYCILIAKEYHERLKMLENCSDGFEISEYDFKNRGEGDLFGIRQSGDTGLILASVKKDYQMLLKAKDDVLEFLPMFLSNKEKYPYICNILNKIENID